MAKKVDRNMDFETFLTLNIKATLAQRKRSNKFNEYKNYLNDNFVLGSGTFGKIY